MNARLIRTILAAVLVAWAWPALVAAQSVKWPSSFPPRPLPAREVTFPAYEMRTLSNGLPVVVVVHNEQPAVSMRLIVRAGAAQDPAGKCGLAAMVATLLDQGTATRTAQQVADTIDSVGGDLETGAGRDLTFANVTVMKDSLDLGITLLADVVRRPAFAQAELERQRQQILASLRVGYQNPEYLATAVFDRVVYGSHPYGFPGNGTPASVEGLTRDDLARFHRRYYAPNNCILAVVGDVTGDEAIAAVTRAFGDWPRQDIPPEPGGDPPRATRRIVVVDKPDAVQTEIRMGQIGIPRKSPDFMAVDLAFRILGGQGANRLHRVLRTERGLTYGVSAAADTLERSGEFVAQTSTRSEATGEVLRLMMDEFARLRLERVQDTELTDVQAYLTGRFPLTIETPDEIATQILDVLFYELPVKDLQTFRQRVNAVSVDDIERAAAKYVQPDRLSVVLVGNAAVFLDQLKRVGFSRVEVIRLPDLDLTAADLRRKDAAGARTATTGGSARPSVPAWPARR
jgi:zinc protease